MKKTLMSALVSIGLLHSASAEKLFKLEKEGKITAEKQGYYSLMIACDIKDNSINYQILVNDRKIKFSEPAAEKTDYAVFCYDSFNALTALKKGENDIQGAKDANILTIAWDEAGEDLSYYITSLIADFTVYQSYNQSEFKKVSLKITGLKKIIMSRLKFLKNAVNNQEETFTNLKNTLSQLQSSLTQMKSQRTSLQAEADARMKDIQKLDSQIRTKEEELKNDPDNYELQAQIATMKKQLSDLVAQNQKTNNQIYELDKSITKTEETISLVNNSINNFPDTIAAYQQEIPVREDNLAKLDSVSSSADTGTGTVVYESSTTVINKKEKEYSFGEIFGISTIPALAIGLPVGMLYSTGYTEIRLNSIIPKQTEPEFNTPNRSNSNLVLPGGSKQ